MAQALDAATRRAPASRFFGLDDPRQGIVHVVGPEQGLSSRACCIVCGDSHTSTHGALGALAFGIGATEVRARARDADAVAAQARRRMRITVDGALAAGVSAKDVILAIIAKIGAAGATGHVDRVRRLDRSARCRWKAG